MGGMVDVTEKPVIRREAEARGRIVLSQKTLSEIRNGGIRKGDPLKVAEIAGIQGAKQTSVLIPYCHPLPLDTVRLGFQLRDDGVEVSCTVKARARTGVEMEALMGVSNALNAVWDMVKYLEKDSQGQYRTTRITDIEVIRKIKETMVEGP